MGTSAHVGGARSYVPFVAPEVFIMGADISSHGNVVRQDNSGNGSGSRCKAFQ